MAGNDPKYTDTNENTYRSLDSPEDDYPNQPNVELSDQFLEFDDWIDEDPPFAISGYPQNQVYAANEAGGSIGTNSLLQGTSSRESGIGQAKKATREKVAFKTKSEVEILDDGFKWRKYGKKMVKNSPNPRNYYRCSAEGCPVKKRVERDVQDPSYVITTYEGFHNHEGPSKF